MAQIRVRDQYGVAIPLLNVRLSLGNKSSAEAYDDRFTDLAGNTAWPNPLPSNDGYTLYANYANVNTKYGQVSKFVTTLDTDIDIVIPLLVAACPVNHNKEQFKTWFFNLVNKYGFTVVSTDAMGAMANDLVACGMKWQNQGVYPLNQWRPRIHQSPFNPDGGSDFDVDCGDFGKPWILTFRY